MPTRWNRGHVDSERGWAPLVPGKGNGKDRILGTCFGRSRTDAWDRLLKARYGNRTMVGTGRRNYIARLRREGWRMAAVSIKAHYWEEPDPPACGACEFRHRKGEPCPGGYPLPPVEGST